MRVIIVFLILIAILIFVWAVAGPTAFEDFGADEAARLAYLAGVMLISGGAFYGGGWRNWSRNLQMLAIWALLLLALVTLYSYRDEFQSVARRMVGALVPGIAVQQSGEMVVSRGRNGMYNIVGSVNGAEVRFIFDTGASSVTLTAEDARRAGLTPGPEDFTVTTMTANGPSQVAPGKIDLLTIGAIQQKDVRVFVARQGALDRSLLGQTFLDRLDSYEVKGDRLILRAR